MSDSPGDRRAALPVWRALALVVLLLVAGGVAALNAAVLAGHRFGNGAWVVDVALALAWVAFGGLLVGRMRGRLSLERDTRPVEERRAWTLFVNLFAVVGYLYLLLVGLAMLRVDLSGVLLGGAVTGIVLGIAAQSALSNLFGGMLVLLLHPYGVGQRIMVRSSQFGGTEYTGIVREVTLFYTALDTVAGRLVIPNATTVASVVRIEGADDDRGISLPLPYRVPVEAVEGALRKAGLPAAVDVEQFGPDTYTARVHVPSLGGDRALTAVMRTLLTPEPGP